MTKIIHISDLHVHNSGARNREAEVLIDRIWRRCYAPIINQPGCDVTDIPYLLVTGDITDDGSTGQYRMARALLSRFYGRLMLVPGNHDYGYLGNFYDHRKAEAFQELKRDLGAQKSVNAVDTVTLPGDVAVYLIDTVKRTPSVSDTARGRVSDESLDTLDSYLKAPLTAWSIVAMHHNPWSDSTFLGLENRLELLEILSNRVDAACYGHCDHGDDALKKHRYGIPWRLNADNKCRGWYEIDIDIDSGIEVTGGVNE